MFKTSKFEKIYLSIIKEQNEMFAANKEAKEADNENTCNKVCFTTENEELINVFKNGFDKVVFTTTDEEKNENTIEFTVQDFTDISVLTCDEQADEQDEEQVDECGDAQEQADEQDEEQVDEQADEQADEQDDEQDDECGDAQEQVDEQDDEQVVNPSEWVVDGVCVKCGSSDCDGSCVCPTCGSQNCIGNCEDGYVAEQDDEQADEQDEEQDDEQADEQDEEQDDESCNRKFYRYKKSKLVKESKGCNKPKKEPRKAPKKK